MWEAREEMATTMTEAYESSFTTGEVPDGWMGTNAVLPFRTGCKVSPGTIDQ